MAPPNDKAAMARSRWDKTRALVRPGSLQSPDRVKISRGGQGDDTAPRYQWPSIDSIKLLNIAAGTASQMHSRRPQASMRILPIRQYGDVTAYVLVWRRYSIRNHLYRAVAYSVFCPQQRRGELSSRRMR